MSPQLINKVLNQNWFVSTQMKEIRRSVTVLETTKALDVLHCIENAAAKFIRTMNHRHHRTMICFIVYCLVLSLNCVNYVNCDIEPHPVPDDDDGMLGVDPPRAPVSLNKTILFCCWKNFQIFFSFTWNIKGVFFS